MKLITLKPCNFCVIILQKRSKTKCFKHRAQQRSALRENLEVWRDFMGKRSSNIKDKISRIKFLNYLQYMQYNIAYNVAILYGI